MIAKEMEQHVVRHLGLRRKYIVPNVSWGWNLKHEADLIVVSKNLWAVEIEIKVSAADLKADAKKEKWLREYDDKISKLIYAVPADLFDLCKQSVPEFCGILAFNENGSLAASRKAKEIPAKKPRRKITEKELISLLRLGCMRLWSVKL